MVQASRDRGDRAASVSVIEDTLIANKYRVLRPLGDGATGTVYLCEHTALEKQVAVKVLHRELADNLGLVERFQREARTAARLDHPNSVRVTDFGQDSSGTLYLAMEYVAGRDLAELIEADWPLSDERIVHIMSGVLSALSAAHALGIVHRDLKPENILVQATPELGARGDTVKVCDFGIAQLSPARRSEVTTAPVRSSDSHRRITGDGMIVGTCAYMSPEQARAEALDARSDLYSAGVVLFQLLTRTLPFVAETPDEVARMHCTTPPPPPSGFGPVHAGLEAVCLRALSKTPEARFQTATEMLAAVRSAVAKPVPSRALGRRRARPPLLLPPPRVRSDNTLPMSVAPTELLVVPPPAGHAVTRAPRRRAGWLVAGALVSLPALAAALGLLPDARELLPRREVSTRVVAHGVHGAHDVTPVAPRRAAAASDSPTGAVLASAPVVQPELPRGIEAPSAVPERPKPAASVVAPAPQRRPSPVAARPAPKPAAAARAPQGAEAPATAAELAARDLTAAVALADEAAAQPTAPVVSVTPVAEVQQADVQPAARAVLPPAAPVVGPRAAAPAPAARLAGPAATSGKPMRARNVSVQLDKAPGGVSKASLRAAINQAGIVRCYRSAAWTPASPTATLAVTTNMTGRIVSARVSDAAMPTSVRECIEQVAKTGQIRDADVGEVHATFGLTLDP